MNETALVDHKLDERVQLGRTDVPILFKTLKKQQTIIISGSRSRIQTFLGTLRHNFWFSESHVLSGRQANGLTRKIVKTSS